MSKTISKKDCKKWKKNEKINPLTGKRLVKNKKPYNKIKKDCEKIKSKRKSQKMEKE